MRTGFLWIAPATVAAALAFAAGGVASAEPPLPTPYVPDGLCLACHSKPGLKVESGAGERELEAVNSALLEASAHGDVACARCHQAESRLPHRKTATPLSESERTIASCARCHEEAYGEYMASPHGTMANFGDERGPVCNDCHGKPHEVRRLEQWDDEQRAGACAECHEGATPKFLQTLIHDHPSAGFLPSAYFAGRFLMLLTAAVLAVAIIHVELDVLRWIVLRHRDHATRGTDHGKRLEAP